MAYLREALIGAFMVSAQIHAHYTIPYILRKERETHVAQANPGVEVAGHRTGAVHLPSQGTDQLVLFKVVHTGQSSSLVLEEAFSYNRLALALSHE